MQNLAPSFLQKGSYPRITFTNSSFGKKLQKTACLLAVMIMMVVVITMIKTVVMMTMMTMKVQMTLFLSLILTIMTKVIMKIRVIKMSDKMPPYP